MKKSPLKILHVTLSLEIGGLEMVIINLCNRLKSSDFTVEVLCLKSYNPDYIKDLEKRGIPVHVRKKRSKFDLRYFGEISKFIRERRIEILHAHSGCFFYAGIFSVLGRVSRYIYTAHGLPVLNRFQDRIEDNIASLVCSTIIPVSDEINKVLQKRMPLAKGKMMPILNGIDTDRFRPFADDEPFKHIYAKYGLPEEGFLVGSVGRLHSVKNFPMLLRAFSKLPQDSGRRPHLVFVGDGPCHEELEDLARKLGVAERVTFLGRQYQVQEILPLMDAFVLSSLTEGTSVALLEAQACGVPAVVTDVGGNSNIIREGNNGFLCKVNDDDAMAAALGRLQADQELAGKMRLAARKRVLAEFDLDAMVQRYEALYLGCESIK